MIQELTAKLSLFAAESGDKAEEAEGIAQLGIDPIAIVLQLGTFLVLFLVLNKFGLNKVVANLKDRQDTISEGLKNAEVADKRLKDADAETENIISEARKQADTIINSSHEEAGAIVTEAQAKANKQADDIVDKAKAQAQTEAGKVREELKSEMLGLIADATEVVIDEKMTDEKDQKLIKKAVSEGATS